jgi:hypothetical protein
MKNKEFFKESLPSHGQWSTLSQNKKRSGELSGVRFTYLKHHLVLANVTLTYHPSAMIQSHAWRMTDILFVHKMDFCLVIFFVLHITLSFEVKRMFSLIC